MNNRGQVFLFLIMLAMVIVILSLALSPTIKEFSDSSRNTTIGADAQGLDCDNSSISDFDKSTCIVVDLYNPYWVGFLLGLAGLVIAAKVVFK